MKKLTKTLKKSFKMVEEFNYQDVLDTWAKETVHQAREYTEGFFHDMTDFYYAQKAIRHHAHRELPFKTLVLLGQKLSQEAYKEDMQKIINENVIKLKGQFYKLNDYENQSKIQKAIRTFEFEECQEIKKAA